MKVILKLAFLLCFLNATYSQSAQDYIRLGNQSLDGQDYFQAIESFRSALRLNEKYADAFLGLAQAYFFSGEYEEVLQQLDQYDALAKSINAHILRGRALAALGRRNEAQILLASVLTTQPNNLDAQFGMAEVQLLNGRYDQAIRDFERLLTRVPDNRRALLSLLVLYDEVKRPVDAENTLKKALYYNPQDPLTLYIAGDHYYKLGDWEKALEYYNLVVLLQKRFPGINMRRAEVLLNLGRYNESALILEDLLKTDARADVNIWAMLGEVFVLQGNKDNAIFTYSEALRLDPNNEIIRLSAEDFARRNYPETSPVRDEYAQFRFQRGEKFRESFLYDKAHREYRIALILSPDNMNIRYEYARLQKLMGYHFAYVNQLSIISQTGRPTQRMRDELEMEEYRPVASVAKDWKMGYGQVGNPIKLLITTIDSENDVPFGSAAHLQSSFGSFLDRYTRFDIKTVVKAESVGDAWREARNYNTDFFVVLRYIDGGRQFYAGYDLYLTSTSALVGSYSLTRVSTDRIDSIFDSLSSQLNQVIPLRATVLERKDYLGIISLGKVHGVKAGDEFIVVRARKSRFTNKVPFYTYQTTDSLGRLRVTRVDEFVSEAQIIPKEQPDTVAREDEVFLIKDVRAVTPGTPPIKGIPEGFLLIH
ncbi:MAG: tetratricopeptide repeat protein [Spirochaetia bacterium]